MSILENKHYRKDSVFKAENLLREAKRQKALPDGEIPAVCLLDPDGDLLNYLLEKGQARLNRCWACYHSKLYSFNLEGVEIGILPCVVGSSYAVLVAEQLFVSGCRLLLSVTSAGIIHRPANTKKFVLITSSVRDEGTSYHYLPPGHPSTLNTGLFKLLHSQEQSEACPYFDGISWTTDAPFRETASAIKSMQKQNVVCVEMEAAALYALAEVKKYPIVCFAHLTNSMAQKEGDFEKGEAFGSLDTLRLIKYVLDILWSANIPKDE